VSGPSVKVPTDWLNSEAVEDLGSEAVLLMLTALAYSAEQLTNGRVPRRAVRKLWPVADFDTTLSALVDAGEVRDEGTDLQFVNWRDFILSSREVEQIREQNALRQERFRRHQKGDHTLCERCSAVRNSVTNTVTNGVTDGVSNDISHTVSNADPIRSAPTRSDPTGGRGSERAVDEGARSAGATRDPREETRGSQLPPPPSDDPEQRLGIKRHAHAPGCCGFTDYPHHGIHQVAS
jgi:hypothetical protein